MNRIFIKCFGDSGKDSDILQVPRDGSEKISDSMLRKLNVSQLRCHREGSPQWYPVTGQDTEIHLNIREKLCLPVDVPKDKRTSFGMAKQKYDL